VTVNFIACVLEQTHIAEIDKVYFINRVICDMHKNDNVKKRLSGIYCFAAIADKSPNLINKLIIDYLMMIIKKDYFFTDIENNNPNLSDVDILIEVFIQGDECSRQEPFYSI
jgi:hypothetical protein